jgi:quercetin dioxygenase-like cupin family protein
MSDRSDKDMHIKVMKITQAAKQPTITPLFTGAVTMQTFVVPDESERFSIKQVNFARG